MQLLKTNFLVTTTSSWSILMAMAERSIPATQKSYQFRVRGLSSSGRESRVWPLGVGEMADVFVDRHSEGVKATITTRPEICGKLWHRARHEKRSHQPCRVSLLIAGCPAIRLRWCQRRGFGARV